MIRNSNKLTKQYQTYPDGWGTVFAVKNRILTSVRQKYVHFADSVVGERRFWDAQVLGISIDRAILVPFGTNVHTGDIFEISDTKYEVRQKQKYDKSVPESWLLSLSETVISYRSTIADG